MFGILPIQYVNDSHQGKLNPVLLPQIRLQTLHGFQISNEISPDSLRNLDHVSGNIGAFTLAKPVLQYDSAVNQWYQPWAFLVKYL